jgi:hypothetical protein
MKNRSYIIDRLHDNGSVFISLLQSISKKDRCWRPAPDKWCLHEILCHLVDEEINDFRFRINSAIRFPGQPVPPIDPEGWVISKKYLKMDFDAKLAEFSKERRKSVKWLREIPSAAFKKTIIHPYYGDMTARALLENWLGHDYLHIRQINRYLYERHKSQCADDLDYAGNW